MTDYPKGQMPCPHDCRDVREHKHYTSYLSPERQPELVVHPLDAERAAFSRGMRAGEIAERAAIVAWLRAKAERAFLGERDPQDSLVGDIATWIERGEHLAGDDE